VTVIDPIISTARHRGPGVDVLLDRVCLATSVDCRHKLGLTDVGASPVRNA
jgi:hypothetical protein